MVVFTTAVGVFFAFASSWLGRSEFELCWQHRSACFLALLVCVFVAFASLGLIWKEE